MITVLYIQLISKFTKQRKHKYKDRKLDVELLQKEQLSSDNLC